jgi:pSer/pThr/pTyr-binding forkhead associated (FHA) protein
MAKLQIYLPDGGQPVHDLPDDKLTVGRVVDNGLQIDDASVSSHHAELVLENGEWHLHDLGSTNGTFVNREQVTDAILRHGDEVRFGSIDAVFHGEGAAPDQAPPEFTQAAAQVAHASARPEGFVSSSPLPKNAGSKDPLVPVFYGAGAVAVVVFAIAAVIILQMAAPI